MKKLIFLLVLPLFILSCSSNSTSNPSDLDIDIFGGGDFEFCINWVVLLNSSENCDDEPIEIELDLNEYVRLLGINDQGCISVTVTPRDGSDSIDGYLNNNLPPPGPVFDKGCP